MRNWVWGLILMLGAAAAQAGTFGVKVVTASGEPIAGAAVCIGTHGNFRQFAAEFTQNDGNVVVEVPNVPLVVTVSKDRFSGLRITEPARQFNLVKEIRLVEGVPGPRCRLKSSIAVREAAPENRSLVVTGVEVRNVLDDDETGTLTLIPSVAGNPSHYRVSDSIDIVEAPWLRYTPTIEVPVELRDHKSLYLQIGRIMTQGGGSIEQRSRVVDVDLAQS